MSCRVLAEDPVGEYNVLPSSRIPLTAKKRPRSHALQKTNHSCFLLFLQELASFCLSQLS